MTDNKIAVVVTYFGEFPNYFPLWLKSCGYNKTVDFYLFTDQKLSSLPSNVYHVPMTLQEMQSRASSVLGFEASLNRPYKCCDYRPLYGLIFSDYLGKYDYWGHCDVDLIFGDLQHFFDTYNLYEYDRFGTLGHLSLCKNTDKVNNAYLINGGLQDYRLVFTSDKNFAFDELGGISGTMLQNDFKVFAGRVFIDIATTYQRYRIIDVYPLDKLPRNYPVQTFIWEEGKIFHIYEEDGRIVREEYIYAHFQKRQNFDVEFNVEAVKSFYISNTGFYEILQSPDQNTILCMNPYKGKIYEAVENRFNLLHRRVKSYLKSILSR